MLATSIHVSGHNCFSDWAGFDAIQPINVIIGRNNSGKSQLMQLVELLCQAQLQSPKHKIRCRGTLDRDNLLRAFPEHMSGGNLGGRDSHWNSHGVAFINKKAEWTINVGGSISDITIEDPIAPSRFGEGSDSERMKLLPRSLSPTTSLLSGRSFVRLASERDIKPEPATTNLDLLADGSGATRIIYRHLHSSALNRELVTDVLLKAVNDVFGSQATFTEIAAQVHDEPGSPLNGTWEIYLGEPSKPLVALSSSGSGLKTVFLALINLLIVPTVQNKKPSEMVFAFEELENNLHPSLLRRLFRYIQNYSRTHGATVFITTHSSVALDLFGPDDSAQIIQVSHDGRAATTRTVAAHFDRVNVVAELGAKPSDLLQANGVVWLEGPSDRIYLNKWIALFSDGELIEGRDYQCAYYGGALLARVEFADADSTKDELANLLRLNSNVIVVCDSDRSTVDGKLKGRVERIRDELEDNPAGLCWITEAREIESYLPESSIKAVFPNAARPRAPEQFEQIFPSSAADAEPNSFCERILQRKTFDKTEFALELVPHFTIENLQTRFDLASQVGAIVALIRKWNE